MDVVWGIVVFGPGVVGVGSACYIVECCGETCSAGWLGLFVTAVVSLVPGLLRIGRIAVLSPMVVPGESLLLAVVFGAVGGVLDWAFRLVFWAVAVGFRRGPVCVFDCLFFWAPCLLGVWSFQVGIGSPFSFGRRCIFQGELLGDRLLDYVVK